jgi:hypothetical protein
MWVVLWQGIQVAHARQRHQARSIYLKDLHGRRTRLLETRRVLIMPSVSSPAGSSPLPGKARPSRTRPLLTTHRITLMLAPKPR